MGNRLSIILNGCSWVGGLLFLLLYLNMPINILAQNSTVTAPIKKENISHVNEHNKQQIISKTKRDRIIANIENDMILVKGDTFQMGANDLICSQPGHLVLIDDFFINKYEVTQEQWFAIMGRKPNTYPYEPQQPVYGFKWDEIQMFLTKLNEASHGYYRLPTEAEWEWAAQGGVQSKHYLYAGSNNPYEIAGASSHNVGSFKPNELGIYDMSGNVAEFCSDYFAPGLSKFQINPTGPSKEAIKSTQYGYEHVIKGDCWGPILFDSHEFYKYRPQYRDKACSSGNSIGFRLASDYIPSEIPQNLRNIYIEAKKGNLTAMNNLAQHYLGNNNSEQYIKWIERIGNSGDYSAYVTLGDFYRKNSSDINDALKAETYYTLALNANITEVSAKLGELRCAIGNFYHLRNQHPVAFDWFLKGAELNDRDCLHNLGEYFAKGTLGSVDYKRAFEYYKKSAELGCVNSMSAVAEYYDMGLGVESDIDKAEYWYQQAANNGDLNASQKLKKLAQTTVTILDNKYNEPLIGCNLRYYRDGRELYGRVSDIDGQYILRDVRSGDVLRFEYVGYKSKEITLKCTDVPHTLTFSLDLGKSKQTEYESRY